MTAAMLAALAVWCLVPEPANRRIDWLANAQRSRPTADLRIVAAALTAVAALVVFGPVLGLLIGIAVAPVVHRAVGRLESVGERRRAARLEAALPGALDLMVSALEVGCPPGTAFALVAEASLPPLGPELAVIASRLSLAADPSTVWRLLADDPALGPLGRAFGRAQASGMPVADVVAGAARGMRRERSARRRHDSKRIAVQTAAPLGACFLPAFFLVGIVPMLVASFASFMP